MSRTCRRSSSVVPGYVVDSCTRRNDNRQQNSALILRCGEKPANTGNLTPAGNGIMRMHFGDATALNETHQNNKLSGMQAVGNGFTGRENVRKIRFKMLPDRCGDTDDSNIPEYPMFKEEGTKQKNTFRPADSYLRRARIETTSSNQPFLPQSAEYDSDQTSGQKFSDHQRQIPQQRSPRRERFYRVAVRHIPNQRCQQRTTALPLSPKIAPARAMRQKPFLFVGSLF